MELSILRHSTSHILAAAILELYPQAKLAIGPSIEDGFYYDFDNLTITEQDLPKIEQKIGEIIKQNLKFERLEKSKEEAKKLLKGQPYKLELLADIQKPLFYKTGDFIDLCSGPHIQSTQEIKAFKLTKLAGAYWKGDSKNKMLTRIYGIAFPTKQELDDYLKLQEEAEKRNHVKLGKELDLFSVHPEGPGFPFFHPKGMIIYNSLVDLWKEKHRERGYLEVKTPIILNRKLWETSGHWENYRENMYFTKIDNQDFAIKPMNCPGGILIYKEKLHSYKELPLKVGELGLVHRHELSGVLNGLLRVRTFTQDDAHIYCTEAQVEAEISNVIDLVIDIYKILGFNEYEFEISTKPEKYVGSDELWESATASLKQVLTKRKIPYKIDEGAGVFYGPKIDIKIRDAIGRKWQCATIQYDFNLPERFDITYEGKDGAKHRPIMIHRVIFGSIERCMGVLIEHYAGHFPLWLSPTQVKLVTVNDSCINFAEKLHQELVKNRIRAELDTRAESIAKKVRDAEAEKVNIIITIGEKEVSNNKLAVREQGKVRFDVAIESFLKEIKTRIEQRE
ncbi:MAG TPA: threonine--tRNA ligase [Candidatus Nanoarchaeia archaeon]|nr:threonine--tRNA ligase [Candidatus Nanoarchaeia archaeon]